MSKGSLMALFRPVPTGGQELLLPEPIARNHWNSAGQLRGIAVSGAMARAAQLRSDQLGEPERFRPARWTVDLFRPAMMTGSTVRTSVVRSGRRLRLVDAELVQDDVVKARASLLSIATSASSGSRVWPGGTGTPDPVLDAPPPEDARWFSETAGWTTTATAHRNDARKATWLLPTEIVAGEKPTPFQHVAAAADLASLVANWGDRGVDYINADLVMHLSRLPPEARWLGLAAAGRDEAEGIAIGRATVFDQDGPLGRVIVDALANADHAIDPRAFDEY
jgi:hypothetical protein